ncbi:MAG TPA: glycoside hydrolase family 57 protein [Terriglobales bacterium]|jgi:alpha-amylase/alpha-mannosidase (GH57 family)|nr:glycoside hydrolase family 57 protein [Terriglobales bacterium]
MPVLRVVVLWHQHQPYYKDLVTGEYRLPWVRLHALKDYYGMVKLLEEFPDVHQTFNLVPSLISQIQDYESGAAYDPFLTVASRPAKDLTQTERRFALQYLFQANPAHLIGRYPRYAELWERFQSAGSVPEKAEKFFQPQDFTDLQVLSQLAWFDEFFLLEPDIAALVKKGRGFSLDDQRFVIEREGDLIKRVIPAHAEAANRGRIEISTSAFYHPILPLVCDTNQGAVSTAGLPLPHNRFRHPEDAREQLQRGLDLHERVFGVRPHGVWPSEGSVSEEVMAIGADLGVKWMATDEGVLARTLGMPFTRDGHGRLPDAAAAKLYTIHRYENGGANISLIFRDHAISDLIGFVYSGMPPQEAADHLMRNIRESAEPVLRSGADAVVPIILDGENAWEYYPESGREFLRRIYDALQSSPDIEAVTVSEAIERHKNVNVLKSLVPGSWINANFNVWIGAPEDNRSWDYLYHARNFYSQASANCSAQQQKTAFEELLIAEGSDWNWWYGPEHHSANDREFDELYRKHLSNVYQMLGATPPDYLAQPIMQGVVQPVFQPQTHYIHPLIDGKTVRYFEWMGAAHYTADRSSGSMHGKVFHLESIYAGIDESDVYGRIDFADRLEGIFEIVVNLESWADASNRARRALRLNVEIADARIIWVKLADGLEELDTQQIRVAMGGTFQFRLPLALLYAVPPRPGSADSISTSRLRLRFSIWQNGLPLDALPVEGWMELRLLAEEEMALVN